MDCGGIFLTVVVVDTFNLSCLMYIARTGQASKAAVYSTLQASWTILIGIVRGDEYQAYVYPYLILIYIGYSLINYDKKKAAEKALKSKVRVRFLRRVHAEYETGTSDILLSVEKDLEGDNNLVVNLEDELRATIDPDDVENVKLKDHKYRVPDLTEEVKMQPDGENSDDALHEQEMSIQSTDKVRAGTTVQKFSINMENDDEDDESLHHSRSTIQDQK